MICLHRPNGDGFVVNVLHIVAVESTPDTLLTLFGGDKVRVRETPLEVVAQSRAFLAHLGHGEAPDPREER